MCGKEINKNELGVFEDYISIDKRWEFGSEFDNQLHSLDICQKCYKNLIAKFKIKPHNN